MTIYKISATGNPNMQPFTLHYNLTEFQLAAYVVTLFRLGYTGVTWQEIAPCNPV